jgi:hypothetical protein
VDDFSKPNLGCHLGLWCQETEDSGVDSKSVWGPKTSEHIFHFDQIMGKTRDDGTLSFTNTCIRFDLSLDIIGSWGDKCRVHRLIQLTAQFNASHCSAKLKFTLPSWQPREEQFDELDGRGKLLSRDDRLDQPINPQLNQS